MTTAEAGLIVSILLVVYTYALYPAAIGILAKRRKNTTINTPYYPSVSILLVAYNEGKRIAQRIENLLELEYDPANLEIVIASDGSTDNTARVASGFTDRRVKVVDLQHNRGKPAVLNQLIPTLRGEVVVLLDARQTLNTDALQVLVQDFSDQSVGAVSGELMFSPPDEATGLEGVGLYWRYEKFIRLNESRIDSVIGATGAFYAFRRELFEEIPEDSLIEDVLIPMQITRKGYRALFKPGATVYDTPATDPEIEFRRKVRTLAGNFQLFHKHSWLLNPHKNRLWIQTISHKALRLIVPLCLLAILMITAALLTEPVYQALFSLQLLFYVAAISAHFKPSLRLRSALFSMPYTFCLLNWSTIVGFYRYARGQQRVTWHRPKQSV